MSKERFNRIIYEAYDKYKTHTEQQQNNQKIAVQRLRSQGKRVKVVLIILLNKEEFIHKCKTDPEFSEKWGLKIEERELSLGERVNLLNDSGLIPTSKLMQSIVEPILSEHNIPSKQITFQYNGEKIEVYE